MNFTNIVLESFIAESVGKSLLLLDIDDTLLTASGIHIYRKLPTDKKEVPLTPDEYAKEIVTADTKKHYDYREFDDPKKIEASITKGTPIWKNLALMDSHIKRGWEIGILTARGFEDVIFSAMQKWLMFKNDAGLNPIGKKLTRSLVKAVNDRAKMYPGATDFEKKANVIRKLSKKYDKIKFLDDDPKNIQAVQKLAKDENIKVLAVTAQV